MSTTLQTCVVCGVALPPHGARAEPTCGAPLCRWRYGTIPKDRTCPQCGRPLDDRELADGVCADARCRHARLRERRRRMRETMAALTSELRRRGAVGIAEPESWAAGVIPAFGGRASRLPGWRRRRFADHLRRVVGVALGGEDPAPAAGAMPADPPTDQPPETLAPDLAALLGHACGRCRGHCCRNGGEHAYISPATIRRQLAAHPAQDAEAIVAGYLAHVGARSYAGSCIFHRPGGCALPREMRSDTCNRYFCPEITQLRRELGAARPARAFLAQSRDGRWLEGAFVDAHGARAARRRLPIVG